MVVEPGLVKVGYTVWKNAQTDNSYYLMLFSDMYICDLRVFAWWPTNS